MRRPTPRRAHRESTLLDYLKVSLSAVLLVSMAAIAALVIVIPLLVGGTALTVLTNSMAPGLPPGTLVVVRPASVDDIRIGDVITYQLESGKAAVVSHRVVQRSVDLEGRTTFITRGDNNAIDDEKPVLEVQIQGKLWYAIPYLGWVNNLIGGGGELRSVVVPIIAGLLFAYALYGFVSWGISRRGRSSRRQRVS